MILNICFALYFVLGHPSRAIIYNGLVVHLTQGSEQGTPPDAPVNQLVHSW